MKKSLFILGFALLCLNSYGQNPYLNNINSQLRSIFQNITYPNPNILFLYDRSAKMSDSVFYDYYSADTINKLSWMQIYDEMYYAAHDTATLTTHETIENYGNSFSGDTIPMAILDFEYYQCKDTSLNSGTYFIFDTINNVLYDNPSAPDTPYLVKNIFMSTPMRGYSNFGNPIFRIDSSLFFTDNVNLGLYFGVGAIRIDFGDGSGWHNFDPTQVMHYQANYTSSGEKIIQVELINDKNEVIKKSKSYFLVKKSDPAITPDEILNFEGIQVGVYHSCNTDIPEKVIIYLEGIDLLDFVPAWGRDLNTIYDEMIHGEHIEELRNFNYTYYVVNWNSSTIDIRFNALHVVNLIEYLKVKYKSSNQQFVLIGESMGGLVGRYALTYMETENYLYDDYSPFFVEASDPANALYLTAHPNLWNLGMQYKNSAMNHLMHKTRSFITLDTPHQGANVPLALQHTYKKAMDLVFPLMSSYNFAYNVGLESKAARQMLIYHIDSKTNPLLTSFQYTPMPSFGTFFTQLNNMGDYPEYCKLVAFGNGSLEGLNQPHDFTGMERVPSDRLLDFDAEYYVRFFKMNFPILSANLAMYTNPSGSGTFMSTGIGNFSFDIKLKFFGINVNSTFNNLYTDNQTALNCKPYCVSPGGYYAASLNVGVGGGTAPSGSYSMANGWLWDLFSYNTFNANGCEGISAHAGWQGFGSNHFNYTLCTDGFGFGFIPLQSAFDYGDGLNLPVDHSIFGDATNVKMSRTPFDVIIGRSGASPDMNEGHLSYYDPYIYNITQTVASNCTFSGGSFKDRYAYYDADLAGICGLRRSLLCLEIGDEEMYLENLTINRTEEFQAQYDVHVNERNPYYSYPSGFDPNLYISGVYSKEFDVLYTPTGYANFLFDQANTPTGLGFSYTNPAAPDYWDTEDVPMVICVNDYAEKSLTPESGDLVSLTSAWNIYPNPNNTEHLVVEGQFNKNENIHFTVIDMNGQIVKGVALSSDENGYFSYHLNLQGLESGVYIVQLSSEYLSENKKLIVH